MSHPERIMTATTATAPTNKTRRGPRKNAERPPTPAPTPLVPKTLKGVKAGPFVGVSSKTWGRMNAAKETPAPILLGSMKVWRTSDLELWVELGMPERSTFERLKADREKAAL